jgi:hypothetical protein
MNILHYAAGLMLAAALLSKPTTALAQTTSSATAATRSAQPSLYFLDGQPSDSKTIEALNGRTIASVNVVKGPDATRIFGAGAAEGVMIVVTKRNVGSEAVAEFNRRYDIQPPLVPAPAATPASPIRP